ncbi:MAG: ABC transporter substrate-binding protein [Desulfovibrio sp.]|jgi:hypothetical protein|nr:ABC transporter substrate-binding protein [Desulfovibrio sp.]
MTGPEKRPLLPSLALCALFCLCLCGCPKVDIGAGGLDTPPPARLSPLDQAKNAYVGGDFAKAEGMAMRLSQDGSLNADQGLEANRVLAASALKNNHPSVALTALDQWRKAAPGADDGKEWQDAFGRALRALSSHDARTRANEVYQDAGRSGLIRSIAGICLAVRQWQNGELGQTMAALENIHTSAAGDQEKAAIESRLALELHLADPSASALAFMAVTDANQGNFPYNIISIDKLRRATLNPATRDEAQAAFNVLAGRVVLAEPGLLQSPPGETEIGIRPGASTATTSPGGPAPGQPVVLALPLSGTYGPISAKIVAGARVACAETGSPLEVIDTDQVGWVSKIDALPGNATVIGGPLRRDDYAKAKAQGLTSRRAVFAFLSLLDSGDEGRTAWRFFSSPEDQVDALLGFTSRLGINGYGVFYPEDNFGRRMASIFEARARAAGAGTVISQSYTPGSQNDWMASADILLSKNTSGSVFRAIFLPDSWKNMDVIVPNFFYQNETRQVLLGTNLWEQGLSAGGFVSMQYYGLAVFPGNWNPGNPSAAGKKLQSDLLGAGKNSADFWSGLGYDFARLSARLGVREGFNAESVNAALQAANIDWSIAPISWNAGVASQQMHLFSPTSDGFAPLNEAQFRAAFDDAWR